MKVKFKTFLAVICSFVILMQTMPLTALADNLENVDDTIATEESNELLTQETDLEAEIIGEDTSKRESNIKYFRRSDGSYTAAIYNEPVHYEENGELVDIDNTLVLEKSENGEEYYTNKKNSFKVKLPAKLEKNSSSSVKVTSNGYTLSWSMVSQNSAAANVIQPVSKAIFEKALDANISSKKSKKEQILENDKRIYVYNRKSSVKYSSISNNIDIKYDVQSSLLKESIILNELPIQTSFSFDIKCDGLKAKLQKDNSVAFYKDGSDHPIFIIAAPYMFDSNQEFSNNIKVELTHIIGGYRYTITPDCLWLGSKERAWPVTIDPTIETSTDRDLLVAAHIQEQYPTQQSGTAHLLYAGSVIHNGKAYENWSYVKLPVTNITSSQRVVNAKLYMFYYQEWNLHTRPTQINLYKVTRSWDEDSITWDNKPSSDSKVIDYAIADKNKSVDKQYDVFDITELAQGWVNNTIPNYGVVLNVFGTIKTERSGT